MNATRKKHQKSSVYKGLCCLFLFTRYVSAGIQDINGQRILFPLTKEQKAIYKAFAVSEPV